MTRCCLFLLLTTLAAPTFGEGLPSVALSEAHKKTCKVFVGDALPGMTLTSIQGETVELASLRGKAATVLVVVGEEGWMAKQLLADLPRDVIGPYMDQGVNTVVMNVGSQPKQPPAGQAYTLLGDASGEQFAKLGTGRLPRVYVLDAEGKILWFDIEYSRSTRRELKQTLAAILKRQADP